MARQREYDNYRRQIPDDYYLHSPRHNDVYFLYAQ
jgi:hypothetical protein